MLQIYIIINQWKKILPYYYYQILQPFIDGIEADSIAYTSPPDLYKGAFSWDLRCTKRL